MGACYRLSVQRIHLKYKSYRATCYVTNLYPEKDTCKLSCSKTCQNTTFTWLEHARPSVKCRGIIGLTVGGSYSNNVTVNRYNGHITGTNIHVRCSTIFIYVLFHRLRYCHHPSSIVDTDCVGRIPAGAWVLISVQVQRALSERKEVLWYPLKHEVGALCATDI